MQSEDNIIELLKNNNIKDEDSVLDIIFSTFEPLLVNGKFKECDNILRTIDCDKVKVNFLIGILSATLPYKDYLVYRYEFVNETEKKIYNTFNDVTIVNNLLFGLN